MDVIWDKINCWINKEKIWYQAGFRMNLIIEKKVQLFKTTITIKSAYKRIEKTFEKFKVDKHESAYKNDSNAWPRSTDAVCIVLCNVNSSRFSYILFVPRVDFFEGNMHFLVGSHFTTRKRRTMARWPRIGDPSSINFTSIRADRF